jgi:hypothetical protein
VETDDHSVGLGGLAATTNLGSITTTQLSIAALTGLDLDTDLGALTFSSNPIILPGSFTAQTALGSVGVADVMGLTGLEAETALGALTTTQLSIASLDGLGLSLTTNIGEVAVLGYEDITGDQTGNYSNINGTQSANYTDITANG